MQTIIVDMTPGFRMPTIYYSQGDVGTQFAIDLRSRFGDSFPTGTTVTIQATKPSGFGFSVAATSVTNGVATFTTTAEMTDEFGRFPAELKVTKTGLTLFTANFYMDGERNAHPEGTTDGQQEQVIPELTQLVERVEDAASSVLDMTVNATTLAAGSQATYSYDEDTNTATFGIPQGEAGAGAAGVVASAYSSSSTYAVGDYVIHNSNLYRCTTAITTAEAFTAAHWTQVVLGDDVSDLKADLSESVVNLKVDISDLLALSSGQQKHENLALEDGKGVKIADGKVINFGALTTWVVSPLLRIPTGCYKIESNFDTTNGSSAYGYAVYDVNHEYITGAQNQSSINIQENYAFIRFTDYEVHSSHDDCYVTFFINNELKNELDYLIDGVSIISPVTMTQGGAIKTTDGSVADFSAYPNWRYSDYIEIPTYTTRIRTNAIANAGSVGIAFYDSNKNYIADSAIGNYFGLDIVVEDAYKYARFTNNYTEQSDDIYLILNNANIYTNPNESFAEAVASGKLLKGTYTLDTTITLEEGQALIGSECIVNVTDSGQIRMNNGSKISGIRFVGTWNPTREAGDGTTYTQYGYVPLITYQNLSDGNSDALFGTNKTLNNAVIFIPYDSAYNATVDNCRFENFDRLAVFGGGRRHQENTNPVICNNYFCDCRMGVYIYGEFIRCYANEYLRCIVGCYLYGGNSNNYGEIMKCCDCGYYFPSNAVAHNEITACETAHCGLAGIYAKTLSSELGCQVTGSQIVDAPIVGDTVGCLALVGCRIDTWLQYASGAKNSVICCNIRKGYMYSKTNQFDVPSDTLITMNRGMGVVPDNAVNWS